MSYPLNEYLKLFTYERHYGDDPDDDELYEIPIVYRVEVYDENTGNWHWASPYPFR